MPPPPLYSTIYPSSSSPTRPQNSLTPSQRNTSNPRPFSQSQSQSQHPQPSCHPRSHSHHLPRTRTRTHSYSHRPRRSAHVPTDPIDLLDNISPYHYHHEGPFDAAHRAKNAAPKHSNRNPIDTLQTSNEEALKATPPWKVADCIWRQRPLDGVAFYPPGTTDPEGNRYEYEEGWNMLAEETGRFRRVPGMKFTDEEIRDDPAFLSLVRRKPWQFHRRKQTM
ncbi:hypothetical protein AJ79_04110 [Helicocarpus griseus UAMH5409]|uniref:Uncharacterized protein n=1 Tax=Helicocarpus griseus UAMH5409 TaxID=1447875 RepID=A0A2B7XUU9_9EURO|nr:hypothetical protein AJ79_04110 [Helicocarpus griseus UAMH5409]